MSAATEQQLRDFIGDAGGLPSARLVLVLETSRKSVLRDGIDVDHDSFGDLQMVFAAHLLESGGAIGGKLTGKSVGDISHSYAGGGSGGGYLDIYRAMRSQISGLSGRIA